MDARAGTHKLYHQYEFNPKEFYEMYLSPNCNSQLQENYIVYPMRQLNNEMSSGRITGDRMTELTIGPVLFKLLVCSEYFKEITVLESNARCKVELEKWLNKDGDALQMRHITDIACTLQGKRDGWKEKEEKTRSRIKQVLMCDFTKENPTDPITVPKSDCFVCIWTLEVISQTQSEFQRNLKKCATLLKLGGHLLFFGVFNGNYFLVGKHKFHILSYDEVFLRQALADCGFLIQCLELTEGKGGEGLIDSGHLVYVRAVKVKEE
ncbi:indolethylamine N-methyltransferase-like [Pelobates fuscus]|uniref:indolethylamine N-methyltransferase-like n=1 Tax=Pelobates fuscus TaxID=191477 RepID=UPI002FE4E6EB